jgi:hypothetical protein
MTPKYYTALKWGALLGGPLAILETLILLALLGSYNPGDAQSATTLAAIADQSNCLMLLLELAVPLLAGWLAARQKGDRTAALIAGLVAGAVVATVNMISDLVLPGGALYLMAGEAPPTGSALVSSMLTSRLMTLLLGAWGGWLGGRLFQGPPAPPRAPRA